MSKICTSHTKGNTSLGLEWEAVFDYQGAGTLSTLFLSWMVIAWGYDTCGIPFFVEYVAEIVAANEPSSLNIWSSNEQGPTKETLVELFASLRALGDDGITVLVEQTKPTIQDRERRGQPPLACDEACLNNTMHGTS